MTKLKLSKLGVAPGYRCNFRCGHCCNLAGVPGIDEFDPSAPSISGPAAKIPGFLMKSPVEKEQVSFFDFCQPGNLTESEVHVISAAIKKFNVELVQFTGGETTFYLKNINQILLKAGDLARCRIGVTTNGHFAKTTGAAIKVLQSLCKWDIVQLSYDKFHKKFLPFSRVRNLKRACDKLGKRLTISLSIQSPVDVLLLNKLKGAGIKDVKVQKIISVGAARINGVAFPTLTFDKKVLYKKCPGIKAIIYLCGRGFSNCCVTLSLCGKYPGVYYPTVEALLKSKFYRLMAENTFGQILRKFNLPKTELQPQHSSGCVLCEYIFNKRPEYIS